MFQQRLGQTRYKHFPTQTNLNGPPKFRQNGTLSRKEVTSKVKNGDTVGHELFLIGFLGQMQNTGTIVHGILCPKILNPWLCIFALLFKGPPVYT